MVWLRVMMPQKMARAKKAGILMASAAGTPSTSTASLLEASLEASSAP